MNARIKRRAEEAAFLLGQSLPEFTETALDEKAQVVLDQNERIVLSKRDFARFVELIENPPPPTPELRKAMAEFQRLRVTYPESNL